MNYKSGGIFADYIVKSNFYRGGNQVPEGTEGAIEIKSAYNENGEYVGSPKDAEFIYNVLGVVPENIPGNSVCTIGFNAEKKVWYGWGHRGCRGFEKGSKITLEDVGFYPSCKDDFVKQVKHCLTVEGYKNVEAETVPEGVKTSYEVEKWNGKKDKVDYVEPYPDKWGRGEWEARNLKDARQMAIDYAEDIA